MNRLRPQPPTPGPDPERRAALAVSVLEARVHRTVMVPRTQTTGAMRLLSRRERAQVRAEVRQVLEALGISGIAAETFTEWHDELAVRTLAVAVRAPHEHSAPLAPLADWTECDDDQINALWERYQDMVTELDPLLADGPPLSDGEIAEIRDAAKKKAVEVLTSFGSRKLALALISSVGPPPT